MAAMAYALAQKCAEEGQIAAAHDNAADRRLSWRLVRPVRGRRVAAPGRRVGDALGDGELYYAGGRSLRAARPTRRGRVRVLSPLPAASAVVLLVSCRWSTVLTHNLSKVSASVCVWLGVRTVLNAYSLPWRS